MKRRYVLMKTLIGVFIVVALLYCISARAGQITLVVTEEMNLGDGHTLCVYQNSNYTFTYMTTESCHHTWTFDTDD